MGYVVSNVIGFNVSSDILPLTFFAALITCKYSFVGVPASQGCISCGTCSYLELTEDHVLTSAYVKIFRIVTRNAVNKSF